MISQLHYLFVFHSILYIILLTTPSVLYAILLKNGPKYIISYFIIHLLALRIDAHVCEDGHHGNYLFSTKAAAI